ncbi:aldehyde dehydrogenase (NADP(+)) [Gilvibacter sp.]|uniref:aldehyde dehydrogenase (NADP(+)) n=1 Tax=Gilvibacter sp. TaxID=2729997 RepID=UPI003F4A7243
MITGKSYIASEPSSSTGNTFKTFDPQKNADNPWVFTEATQAEVDEAVNKATEAFESFRSSTGAQRAALLNAIADQIMNLGDTLIDTYCAESGLPAGRAQGERGRTVFQLRTFADLVADGSWVEANIDTGDPDRTPAPKPDLRKMNIPLGPVAVFGASNFPLAYSTAGGDTAAAFAAGCPVIVKSHPMHAGTGELVAQAISTAVNQVGMHPGIFSNLNSSGIEVGTQLVSHPGIKAVGFTGSIKGGRALYDLAAAREEPIPVFAEMGSINPVVALPSALSEDALGWAQKYAGSINLGTGQFCTNPGLILGIVSEEFEAFEHHLQQAFEDIAPQCMLHPKIKQAFDHGKQQADAQAGTTTVVAEAAVDTANYASPMVLRVSGAEFLANDKLHHEVFGPYSLLVSCASKEELLAIIKNLEGQLTGTILATQKDLNGQQDLVNAMQNRVGRLIFNGVPTGVEVCPSMLHGGPYPASTDSRFSAVGIHSIKRWVRPFSFQDWPDAQLPQELQNANPLGIHRLVNNKWTTDGL